MTSKRRAICDLLFHTAVYGWCCTVIAACVYAVSRSATLSNQVCVGFSALFWLYFAVRALLNYKLKGLSSAAVFQRGTFVFFIISLIVIVLFADNFDLTPVMPFAYITAVISCLADTLTSHILGIDQTLDAVSHFSKQPVSAIRRHNNIIIAVFTALAALFIFLVFVFISDERLNAWLGNLLDWFAAFVRWLFRNSGGQEAATPAPFPEEPMPGMLPSLPEEEPNLFMRILSWIIRNYFLSITVISLVVFIYLFYVSVKGFRFKKRVWIMDNGDVSEVVGPDPGEWLTGRFLRGGRMPSDPVRRAFYKKVRKYRDIVELSDTALQMADKRREKEPIDELAAQYQQARYTEGINGH
jgi:hypothetical protein